MILIPKEKAKELIDKIYYCQRYEDGEDYIPLEAYKRAKQCALVAVDEIIKDKKAFNQISIEYWEDVKQEIENL